VLHGLALGETVIGAEPTPIAAYLAGLAFVQAAIVVATTWIYRKLSQAALLSQPLAVRAMGAVVALAGAGALGATLVG
jgi:urease accessory protein